MAQWGDASLREELETLKRENEALVAKCEPLTLDKELQLLERDKSELAFLPLSKKKGRLSLHQSHGILEKTSL
ncbi:hypothetical protein DPMN_039337 [Dreissena polymorpha]|uniref:Uncharacterized protein n=1 Tax=Dreissena polymorpha TaxID=45954 RepID=A0A9D4MIQ7_DREPO|nr:hypothetical protein DPMN_039337 [Dreissena polymorpha]